LSGVGPVDDARRTYRYLRLGMAGVLLALAVSVGLEVARSGGCWQRSISAYYYTPTRPVLVGTLLVLGFAMVVLVGRTPVEEVALDLAGLFAPVVAFVPTTDVNTCSLDPGLAGTGAGVAGGGPSGAPAVAEATRAVADAVLNNMATYLMVVPAALILLQVLPALVGRLRDDDVEDPVWARTRRASYAVGWVFTGAYLLWWRWAGDADFRRWAHPVSAVLLFVCIVVVTAATAYDRTAVRAQQEPAAVFVHRLAPRVARSLRSGYGLLTVAMVLAFAVCAVVHLLTGWVHWVLVVEVSLVTLFAAFWLVQTVELWDEDPRRPSSP
jgi:hypothetical protein